MISTTDLMMLKEAVSSAALENGWDKEKEQEMFDSCLNILLEAYK